MEFRILGPLEADDDDGEALVLGSGKRCALRQTSGHPCPKGEQAQDPANGPCGFADTDGHGSLRAVTANPISEL
jgi:hypothetical protein